MSNNVQRHTEKDTPESIVFFLTYVVSYRRSRSCQYPLQTLYINVATYKYKRQHLQLCIDRGDIYFAHPLNVLPLSQHLKKITPINGIHIVTHTLLRWTNTSTHTDASGCSNFPGCDYATFFFPNILVCSIISLGICVGHIFLTS